MQIEGSMAAWKTEHRLFLKQLLHYHVPFSIGTFLGLHKFTIFVSHRFPCSLGGAPMHPSHFRSGPFSSLGTCVHNPYPLRHLLLIFPLDLPSLQISHHPSSPPIGDLCPLMRMSLPQRPCGLNIHPRSPRHLLHGIGPFNPSPSTGGLRFHTCFVEFDQPFIHHQSFNPQRNLLKQLPS